MERDFTKYTLCRSFDSVSSNGQFPLKCSCSSCEESYLSFLDFLKRTTLPGVGRRVPREREETLRVYGNCGCNTTLMVDLKNPENICEIFLQALESYGGDEARLFADYLASRTHH